MDSIQPCAITPALYNWVLWPQNSHPEKTLGIQMLVSSAGLCSMRPALFRTKNRGNLQALAFGNPDQHTLG